MPSITGTQTEQNLLKAFTGESQAHARYTAAALQASKEGHPHIAEFFEEIAKQEKIHAEQYFDCLENPPQVIPPVQPPSILSTEENLKNAVASEHEEWSNIYPECARIAKEEGFIDVAQLFINIASAEKQHEKRYLGFLNSLKADLTPLKGEIIIQWCCRNCGFVHTGPTAPLVCGICKMPQDWFDVIADN